MSSLLRFGLLGLAACGGGASAAVDGGPGGDAPPGPPVDAAPRPDARTDCPVPRTFVAPAAVNATAVRDATGSVTLEVDLDGAAAPDRFQLRLIDGRGVFIDGLVTGQFGINGAQLDNDSCALCLMVLADVDGAGTPSELYFAENGLLRLDAVDPRLTGVLTDVDFQHVSLTVDPPHTTPIRDGCTTHISSLSFDVAITGP